MNLIIGNLYEATIEKLVYGGLGLAHIDGHTVLVTGTAPGDRVVARITELERSIARAVADQILSPSESRRVAPCQHFGLCGGCHLQHIQYQEQLKVKAGFIAESLRRIGRIDWDREIPMISGNEFGYRSRAEVKLSRIDHLGKQGATKVGFFKTGSHEICEVSDCPVLSPASNTKLKCLTADPESIPRQATRVYLTEGDDAVLVTPATGEKAREADIDAMGIVFQTILGKKLGFGPKTFFQSNRQLTPALVEAAIGDAEGAVAVDLYAGAGLFTLALADHFGQVRAVEGSPVSSAHARDNAELNGIFNVQFYSGSVESWLKHKAAANPDFVILDPPRAGAGATVVGRLVELKPERIVYVSCDPTTLARDLKQFTASGYALAEVTGVDMFPQTYHVETIAKLERN